MSELFKQELSQALENTLNLRIAGIFIDVEQRIYNAENSYNSASLMIELPLSSSSFQEQFRCELDAIVSSAISLDQDYEERMNSDEHPEWHVYEIAEGDLQAEQRQLRNKILAEGWVYISKPLYNKESKILVVQGRQDALEKLQHSSDIATSYSVEWQSMKPEDVKKILGAYDSKSPLSQPAEDGFFQDQKQEKVWQQAIRSLSIQGYGWITGARNLLVCALHEHMQIAMMNVLDRDIHQQFKEFERTNGALKNVKFRKKQAMLSSKKGINAELKLLTGEEARLEMEKSEKHRAAISALYGQGWIRLATMTSENGSSYLYAEGRADMGKKARNLVSSIADSMGVGLVLNGKKLREPEGDGPPQSSLFTR